MKNITVVDYCTMFIPHAGYILIEKDGGIKNISGILVPKSVQQRSAKWSGTGIIKTMSPFYGEKEHDRYLHTLYNIGDHVAFNTTAPIDVPIPPDHRFSDEDVALVLIHIADLLGCIASNEETREKILKRT